MDSNYPYKRSSPEDGDDEATRRFRLMMEAGRSQEAIARSQQLLGQQPQQQQQQQGHYVPLESAQQQLALAIARQRQSEHDAYLRQHELQRAAAMVELASRQQQQRGGGTLESLERAGSPGAGCK